MLGLTKLFRGDGFLFWRNGWQYGDTLFAFQGGPATRSGADRNHFVLEAYGERLLLDPGICAYSDPEANLFKLSVRHNVITFDDEDQRHRDSKNAAVMTEFLAGELIEFAESDATLAYQKPKLVVRTMAFARPDYFVISDIAENPEPVTISLNLNCGAPARMIEDRTVMVEGEKGRLRIVFLNPQSVTVRQHVYRTDTPSVSDYHLSVSPPQKVAATQFVTILVPSPARLPERILVSRLPCKSGFGAVVKDGGCEDLVLVASAADGDIVRAKGIEARARMAIMRHQHGRLCALAMMNGTRLSAPGGVSVTAASPVTLSVSYRQGGTVVVKGRGKAGTVVAIPLRHRVDKAWALKKDGTFAQHAFNVHGGLVQFELPAPATEYDEAVLMLGRAPLPVKAAPPVITRVVVDGKEVKPNSEMDVEVDHTPPREVKVEVKCPEAGLNLESVRLLVDMAPISRGNDLLIQPLCDDASRLRMRCKLVRHVRQAPRGFATAHTVTFQISNNALNPARADFSLRIGRKVTAQPGVSYLSDLKPLEAFARGGVGSDAGYWSPHTPLRIAGVTYAKSVAMHPEVGKNAYAIYDVSAYPGMVFRATAGISDDAGGGSCEFIVKLQREGEGGDWEEVFHSPNISWRQDPAYVEVPIGGADRLRLEVNDAGDGIHCDHAVWADAKIVLAMK